MNKQGTETGMSNLSKSSRHLVDFQDQCQDVLCVYLHVLITQCT